MSSCEEVEWLQPVLSTWWHLNTLGNTPREMCDSVSKLSWLGKADSHSGQHPLNGSSRKRQCCLAPAHLEWTAAAAVFCCQLLRSFSVDRTAEALHGALGPQHWLQAAEAFICVDWAAVEFSAPVACTRLLTEYCSSREPDIGPSSKEPQTRCLQD